MSLTDEQIRAVRAPIDLDLTIEAGPGTGKTHTLVHRVRHLLAQGIEPSAIVCLSFTVAAAEELQDRIAEPGVLCSTIHAWAHHQLDQLPQFTGRTIYDQHDADDVRNTIPRSVAPAQQESLYRQRLRTAHAADYDLLLVDFRANLGQLARYGFLPRHVLVDEVQDLDAEQHALLDQLRAHGVVVTTVGDPRQCQPPGTMVTTPDGAVDIATLADGDLVCAWDRRNSNVETTGRAVRVACRDFAGDLIVVEADGRTTRTTPNHRWLVRWGDHARDLCCTYLMRKGAAWRIGWCKVLDESGGFRAAHYKLRARLEEADAIYILRTYTHRQEATADESVWSAQYGVLTANFKARGGLHTQDVVDGMFQRCPGGDGALRLLTDQGRSVDHPIWYAGEPHGGRQTLFEVQACNLMAGMSVPAPWGRKYQWHAVAVRRESYTGPVYSLDVAKHHAYVADGICTLNSIYRWRAARPDLWTPHGTVVALTGCRRCPVAVLQHAERYASRWPSIVSTTTGGELRELGAVDDPAPIVDAFVAETPGVRAVLTRTWWQAGVIERQLGELARWYGETRSAWDSDHGTWLSRWIRLALRPGDDNLAHLVLNGVQAGLGDQLRTEVAPGRMLKTAVARKLVPAHPKGTTRTADVVAPLTAARGDGRVSAAFLEAVRERPHLRTLRAFSWWWAFRRGNRTAFDGDPSKVHVMTVHAAKGLEVDSVLAVYPDRSTWPTDDLAADEAGIRYVACTRARSHLWIMHPPR